MVRACGALGWGSYPSGGDNVLNHTLTIQRCKIGSGATHREGSKLWVMAATSRQS